MTILLTGFADLLVSTEYKQILHNFNNLMESKGTAGEVYTLLSAILVIP